jgi:hypothetical protein
MPNLICEVCGAAGDNRCYPRCPFYKPLLKWKRATWRRQETHCGRYFVDCSENGFWNCYRAEDEYPFDDRSRTRWEAKLACEKDADRHERKGHER